MSAEKKLTRPWAFAAINTTRLATHKLQARMEVPSGVSNLPPPARMSWPTLVPHSRTVPRAAVFRAAALRGVLRAMLSLY